jgi:curved DNA-binding protein CbpA
MSMHWNPFEILGLPARRDLTTEQVDAAWRAIAVATHPDREDGGDLARYTQATAAFAELRVPWSRSEAWADQVEKAWAAGYDGLDEDGQPYTDPLPRVPFNPETGLPLVDPLAILAQLPGRVRRGRPLRLALRAATTAVLALLAATLIPSQPVAPAAVLALIGWFIMSGRHDLAPAPER